MSSLSVQKRTEGQYFPTITPVSLDNPSRNERISCARIFPRTVVVLPCFQRGIFSRICPCLSCRLLCENLYQWGLDWNTKQSLRKSKAPPRGFAFPEDVLVHQRCKINIQVGFHMSTKVHPWIKNCRTWSVFIKGSKKKKEDCITIWGIKEIITVFDAILTVQSGQKWQCLYGNPMANKFLQYWILRNLWIATLKYQAEDCIHQVWRM